MEIAKIVVGLDFSEQSEVAARQAIQIARRTGAQVVLVHASQMPDSKRDETNQVAIQMREVIEARLSVRRNKLQEWSDRLREELPGLSHMLVDGFADDGLCQAGRDLNADLVVLGTHGRTGLSHFLLGSVAERVVRHYERGVMVARPGADGQNLFKRILVPTDFSVHAEEALKLALILAAPGATVNLFHAWDTPPEMALEWSGPILEELAKEADASGQNLLGRFARDELTLGFDTARGRPAASIQEVLQRGKHDLVIMGSHGRRGLARFLLGSVAEKTVRHAPCSVIVTHRHED